MRLKYQEITTFRPYGKDRKTPPSRLMICWFGVRRPAVGGSNPLAPTTFNIWATCVGCLSCLCYKKVCKASERKSGKRLSLPLSIQNLFWLRISLSTQAVRVVAVRRCSLANAPAGSMRAVKAPNDSGYDGSAACRCLSMYLRANSLRSG
jgi:hypothetical protein